MLSTGIPALMTPKQLRAIELQEDAWEWWRIWIRLGNNCTRRNTMTHFSSADHTHMALALELAERGLFTTRPNPRVGCVRRVKYPQFFPKHAQTPFWAKFQAPDNTQ